MDINIEQLIKEYEENKQNLQKYASYMHHVREYKGYMFKEIGDLNKFNNEVKWLIELMKLNYSSPKIIGTYNQVIITEKINGNSIQDDNAKEHLYNIGKLIASLHNLPIESNNDWKEMLTIEFKELKDLSKNLMEKELYIQTTNFLEQAIEDIELSKNVIIHRDIRPENVILKDDKYYLLDFESMSIGDRDYDFIRMFNIFKEKNTYQYEDFKNFIDGYKSITDFNFSLDKWKLYSKYYAFRLYTRMLCGKVNRSPKYEEYLRGVLKDKNDRIAEWITRYNDEHSIEIQKN